MFMAFDILEWDKADVRTQPLQAAGTSWKGRETGPPTLLLPVRRLADDGLKAWQQGSRARLRGPVAKDPESPYVGGRSLKWLKVKVPKYREQERAYSDPK